MLIQLFEESAPYIIGFLCGILLCNIYKIIKFTFESYLQDFFDNHIQKGAMKGGVKFS